MTKYRSNSSALLNGRNRQVMREGEEVNLINHQEITLTKEFVAEHFKPDVLNYVRKAAGRDGFKFQRFTLWLKHDLLRMSNSQYLRRFPKAHLWFVCWQ